MRKLNPFTWLRKDKIENKTPTTPAPSAIDIPDSNEKEDDVPDDLHICLRKRQETDEDAFSVHSVDCKQGRWQRHASSVMEAMLTKVGISATSSSLRSKSKTTRTSSTSQMNLNSISERCELSAVGTVSGTVRRPYTSGVSAHRAYLVPPTLNSSLRHRRSKQTSSMSMSCCELQGVPPESPNFPNHSPDRPSNASVSKSTNLSSFDCGDAGRGKGLNALTEPSRISPRSSLGPTGEGGLLLPSMHQDLASCVRDTGQRTPHLLRRGVDTNKLSQREIHRQNIIFELYQGEVDTVKDLHSVLKNYKEPMEKLGLLTEGESFDLFYKIDHLIPLHEDLICRLEAHRSETEGISSIGKCFLKWVDDFKELVRYCAHLRYSKHLLEEKRTQKEVEDFLARCQASPFSRKLDLWDFLDHPRSRLMKYPLIVDRIIKATPFDDSDLPLMKLALKRLERVIEKVDKRTGEEMCNFYLEKFDFIDENEHIRLVKSQTNLILDSKLRTGRGTKVHAFLFHDVLVFTLPYVNESKDTRYRVYRDPLPTGQLALEDMADGDIKMGSFRSTFSTDKASRNIFRLTLLSDLSKSDVQGPGDDEAADTVSLNPSEYTGDPDNISICSGISIHNLHPSSKLKSSQTVLQAAREDEKKLWLTCLRSVVAVELPKQQRGSTTTMGIRTVLTSSLGPSCQGTSTGSSSVMTTSVESSASPGSTRRGSQDTLGGGISGSGSGGLPSGTASARSSFFLNDVTET